MLLLLQIASWHIRQKFYLTSEQLKCADLDLRYFHRRLSSRTSYFVVGMIYSLVDRRYSFCTVFWVSSFYLSVNIVVLYQFTVMCIENLEREVSRTEKRFQDGDCVFGSSTTLNGFVKADVK